MPRFRIQLVSEPVTASDFEDSRSMRELCDGVVRDGYCTFEGRSNRPGNGNQGVVRQTVFAANIARITEL